MKLSSASCVFFTFTKDNKLNIFHCCLSHRVHVNMLSALLALKRPVENAPGTCVTCFIFVFEEYTLKVFGHKQVLHIDTVVNI